MMVFWLPSSYFYGEVTFIIIITITPSLSFKLLTIYLYINSIVYCYLLEENDKGTSI